MSPATGAVDRSKLPALHAVPPFALPAITKSTLANGLRVWTAEHAVVPMTGLLLLMIRYAKSPIGRIPTQVDYSDYRDVNGIKMPFHLTFAWLDGRDAIQLSEVKTNVPVDAAKFGKP